MKICQLIVNNLYEIYLTNLDEKPSSRNSIPINNIIIN